jgi:hypothetical protein
MRFFIKHFNVTISILNVLIFISALTIVYFSFKAAMAFPN